MRLKNIEGGKSNLFAYLRFCVFCARKEKKMENKKQKIEKKKRKKSPQCNVNVLGSLSMQM